MKMKMRPRYYCDHCGKGGGSAYHMRNHEAACTMNPDRNCKMCDFGDLVQHPIAELIAALGIGDDAGMTELRDLTEGCPVCILAAIRQSKLQHGGDMDEDGYSEGFYITQFDFKKDRDEFLKEMNDARAESEFNRYADY